MHISYKLHSICLYNVTNIYYAIIMNTQKQLYIEKTLETIRENKVITIKEITNSLHCSIRTAHTRLKEWGALCSYNQNGKYYTLSDIARFNNYGIWRYQNIGFSQYGNLKQTFIHLIRNSNAGLSSVEIGEILSLDPRSFVSHFRELSDIKREKIGDYYIYFSSESNAYQTQRENRTKEASFKATHLLDSSMAILVLVEKIKHPQLNASGLSQRLKSEGVDLSAQKITEFFAYHGIEKKIQLSD